MDTREWSILLTQTLLPEGKAILEAVGTVRENPRGRPLTEDEMIEYGAEADAFVSTWAEPHRVFSRRVIEAARRLKVIGWTGVGFDHIDLDAATERGVYVTYQDLQCPTVADHAFTLLLCAARRIIPAYEAVRAGRWEQEGNFIFQHFVGQNAHHRTLGIVGLGRIGGDVARRAHGFDMKVLYYDAIRREDLEKELGVVFTPLETLLRQSDYISCHLPLGTATRKFFGAKEFSLMKPHCIFVNTSRGGVVDTDALHDALRNHRIGMAALDVIDPEPLPSDHPILRLDNLLLVPHMAGATVETISAQHVAVGEDTVRVLKGFRPLKLLNPHVLDVRPLPHPPAQS
jgi:glyoxylate reductase